MRLHDEENMKKLLTQIPMFSQGKSRMWTQIALSK